MSSVDLRVYEHPCVPDDEAWLVRQPEAEEVPPDLRGRISAPCILTRDAALLGEQLTLLHLAEVIGLSGIAFGTPRPEPGRE